MSATTWIFAILVGIFAGGWVVRAVGQAIPWKSKDRMVYFRDMSYLAGVGLAIGIGAILYAIYLYFFGTSAFIGWAINGFLGFAVVAYYFRLIGINIGTEGSRKFFRQMPLTAAFGIMVIIVYAFFSIFAGQISVITVFFVAFVGLLFCLTAERRYTAEATKMIVFIVLTVVALFTAMFFIGPLAPYGQEEVFARANLLPGGDAATGGDPAHLLGTDQIGRDILSRIIYGAQNTVGIAFVTTCLAFLIGITMGFMAAIKGGWADQLFSRIVDALMAIPQLIFALLLMTIATAWAGSDKALVTIYMILIIAVLDSTRVYRLSRAVGLNIVVMDYIEAAKLRGENISYLVFKEILPNAFAPLLAEFGLRFCFVFLTIAALSFLGIGIQPPLADWGTMVKDLSAFINFAAFSPLTAALPLMAAGAIALLTVGVNFVVDWMLQKSSGLKE
ncbi:MAG: ABC transporter permease [Pseudomonadota bacterium]